MKKETQYWEEVSGWGSFDLSSVIAPRPKAKTMPPLPSARPKRKALPPPSIEDQWDAFLMKCVGTDAAQAPD